MGRDYYEGLKNLARQVRVKHGVKTASLGLAVLRSVCKAEAVTKIDLWEPKLRRVRAAYTAVGEESYILLNANIPKIPRLFSLAHELKHHLCDREVAQGKLIGCEPDFVETSGTEIEIGAEVFAAEFIFPEVECRTWVDGQLGNRVCTPEEVVHLKRSCQAKVSYTFLVKRLEWFGYIKRGAFTGVQFQKLENKIYGVPFYLRRRPKSHG